MKKITVIGQGFVGFPMSVALASKKNKFHKKIYQVIGLEADNKLGNLTVQKINNSIMPTLSNDEILKKKYLECINKNYISTCNKEVLKSSKIIIVSISFNFRKKKDLQNLYDVVDVISKKISKKTLLLFETTFPPGMCEFRLLPIIKKNLKKRKMNLDAISIAYSYERIMPGKNYFKSIVNIPRSYSGINNKSKKDCKNFLKTLLNNENLLYEHDTILDCETAKILENSFRATNIALIDEWVKFSIKTNVNLSKIIDSIKLRSTHSNLMSPGLGVGGYCLTKDPSFLPLSAKKIFDLNHDFPIINLSQKINYKMPLTSLRYVLDICKKLSKKKILIIGFTYKEDVADFRNSPGLAFAEKLISEGASVTLFDPYSSYFENKNKYNIVSKYNLKDFDIVAICVRHTSYKKNYLRKMSKRPYYFDLNRVYTSIEIKKIKLKNFKFFQLGSH
jgi:UDP-N-acetyl-D-glucosamine dehydrogenase